MRTSNRTAKITRKLKSVKGYNLRTWYLKLTHAKIKLLELVSKVYTVGCVRYLPSKLSCLL